MVEEAPPALPLVFRGIATMNSDLVAALLANAVPQAAIDHMPSKGCLTIKQLANWTENRSEVADGFFLSSPHAKDPATVAGTKQAWRELSAIVDRQVKRTAEGLDSEIMDEPLHFAIQQSMEVAFKTKCSWA